jgi:hypothetical protein
VRFVFPLHLAAAVTARYKAAWQKQPPLTFVQNAAAKPANGKVNAQVAWPGTR